ncbi:MAG: hypothetical protein QXK06_05250 [Candidatus Diapherotrites archaeon]
MQFRMPSLHPNKNRIKRLKRQARFLQKQGLNRRERRAHIIASQNNARKKLSIARKPLELQEIQFRAQNKAEKLYERLQKEKDPKKRRKLIESLGSTRVFQARYVTFFWSIAENRRLGVSERIAAIKAIENMSGLYSTKVLLQIAERLPLSDIASIEILNIVSKKIRDRPEEAKKAMREIGLQKRKILLCYHLANHPSRQAIKLLSEVLLPGSLKIQEHSTKITPEMREGIQALLKDNALLGESKEEAIKLLKKIQLEAQKSESSAFNLYSNIFISGIIASSIKTWFKNFGYEIPIDKAIATNLVERLEAQLEQLQKISGMKEARFAIQKTMGAIAIVKKFTPPH